jgi:hypothetical protein
MLSDSSNWDLNRNDTFDGAENVQLEGKGRGRGGEERGEKYT